MSADERQEYLEALRTARANLQRAEAIQQAIVDTACSTTAAHRLGSIQTVLRSMEALI